MPAGLWESHAHNDSDNSIYYGDRMGRLWPQACNGVTSVRGLARNNAYRALQHREAYNLSGAAGIGPRLFAPRPEAVDGEQRVYYPMMIPNLT